MLSPLTQLPNAEIQSYDYLWISNSAPTPYHEGGGRNHQAEHSSLILDPSSTLHTRHRLHYSTSQLVRAFRLWEQHGGSTKSLFMLGGAPGSSEILSPQADKGWIFSTTVAFDQEVSRDSISQDICEVYNMQVEVDASFTQEIPRLSQRQKGSCTPPGST